MNFWVVGLEYSGQRLAADWGLYVPGVKLGKCKVSKKCQRRFSYVWKSNRSDLGAVEAKTKISTLAGCELGYIGNICDGHVTKIHKEQLPLLADGLCRPGIFQNALVLQ